jgi:hypothetical protein
MHRTEVPISTLSRRTRQQSLFRTFHHMSHYNFCWLHGSLTGTPAMAAKVTGHPWSMDELYEKVMATVDE